MRRFLAALPIAALALAAVTTQAAAQAPQKSRGTLINMAADSITVKVGTAELKFGVDEKTHVLAAGAGTKSRQAAAARKPAPKLSDLLKVGDNVEVSYSDAGGRHADEIRKVSSPGSGGIPGRNAAGTVTAVSATSLSITGSRSGGASFTQTFVLDDKTKVAAKGASTKLAASGGRGPAPSVIEKGDHVSVSFDEVGGALHASDVRVTMKATK